MSLITFFSRFKLVIILASLLTATVVCGDVIPVVIKSFCYALSLSIKSIIIFLLPVVIFIFLWSSLISLQNRAGKFLILLLALVTVSNFIGINLGYVVGVNFLPLVSTGLTLANNNLQLIPTWQLILPEFVSTKVAILASGILGLFFALKPNLYLTSLAQKLSQATTDFLRSYFTPILPLFILGFLFKLEHEKMLSSMVTAYGPMLLLIAATQLAYLAFLYLVAAGFNLKQFWQQVKNIAPASITAFSTCSSAATLPLTIICTEKNLTNRAFARIILPATCNIHTLGSAIGITIMALATMKTFNFELPAYRNFIEFAFYYTLAKYGVAGVPGGAIVVVAPLLETYLGFTPEMLGIITALYLLFDPCGTAVNVTGNGAFAIIFSKIYESRVVKKLFRE